MSRRLAFQVQFGNSEDGGILLTRTDAFEVECAHGDGDPWLSVCVPAHNEQASIAAVTTSICEALGSRGNFEVVLVDDASTDATLELVKELCSRDPGKIKMVSNEKQLGLGGSLRCGIQASTGEIFTWIPADGEYEPRQILDAIDSRLSSAQALVFLRTRRDGPVRNGVSKVLYKVVWRLFGVRLRDYCGIFAVRRSQLELLPVGSTSTFFTIEVLIQARRLGWQILERPITWKPRQGGSSSVFTVRGVTSSVRDLILAWFRRSA